MASKSNPNNPDSWDFNGKEKVGRYIDTKLRFQEIVTMERGFWAYYDFLMEKGVKNRDLIDLCYKRHPGIKLDNSLPWLLHYFATYVDKTFQDDFLPDWMIVGPMPKGYEKF